jgi:hypothetical protein
LMDFLYLNETEQCNVLKLLEVGMGWGGELMGAI